MIKPHFEMKPSYIATFAGAISGYTYNVHSVHHDVQTRRRHKAHENMRRHREA